MTNDPALLVHRYLEGSLEEPEAVEFNERVRTDPEFRTLLARMSFDEVALRELIGPAEARPAIAPKQAPAGRWHWMATRGSVAAAAVILVGIVALLVFTGRGEPLAVVASGRIAVNGAESVRADAGSRVIVLGDAPALVRFRDGVTVEFASGTEAVLNAGSVEIVRGSGGFTGTLRVTTPLGQIDARSAAFRAACGPDSVHLTLTSGIAEIRRNDLFTMLMPGQERELRLERLGAGNKAWVDFSRKLRAAKVSLLQAVARAAGEGGPAIGVEFDVENKRLAWEVKFVKGALEGEVKFDAADGTVVERDDSAEDVSARATGMTLASAVEAALRSTPGQAVSAEFKIRHGRLVARTVILAGERLLRITVDGRTGAVIDRCSDDDDDW